MHAVDKIKMAERERSPSMLGGWLLPYLVHFKLSLGVVEGFAIPGGRYVVEQFELPVPGKY